jgi:DNA mismatch endonuclease, patch repair protein
MARRSQGLGCSSRKATLGVTDQQVSWASSEAIRRTMLACRNRDTRPEKILRSLLHASGLRFRVCTRPISEVRRTADIVFTRVRVAVFVDGCFWHGCPQHYKVPRTNTEYWVEKITGNQNRDEHTNKLLQDAGWTVVRVWEHEDPVEAAEVVAKAVGNARAQGLLPPK